MSRTLASVEQEYSCSTLASAQMKCPRLIFNVRMDIDSPLYTETSLFTKQPTYAPTGELFDPREEIMENYQRLSLLFNTIPEYLDIPGLLYYPCTRF